MKKQEIFQIVERELKLGKSLSVIYNEFFHMKDVIGYPRLVKEYMSLKDKIEKDREPEIEKFVVDTYLKEKQFRKTRILSGVSDKKIKDILTRNKIELFDALKDNTFCQRVAVNESYFESINSAEKAYYLGLMYSDGVVYIPKNCIHYKARISLKEEDSYILEVLNKNTNFGRKMQRFEYKSGKDISGNGKLSYPKPCVVWTVSRKKMCQDLVRLGCGTKKSLILEFPYEKGIIPDEFFGAFLRGYLDGDGCTGIYNKNLCVSLSVSDNFAKRFSEFYKERFNASCHFQKSGKITNLTLNDIRAKIEFYYYIYGNTEFKVHLKRKKENFDNYIDFLNEKAGKEIYKKIIL